MTYVLPEGLSVNRTGVTTEYKRGVYYLSHTVWQDGHEEIEIHRCAPEELFHSFDDSERDLPKPEQALHTCDSQQFTDVFATFANLPTEIELPNAATVRRIRELRDSYANRLGLESGANEKWKALDDLATELEKAESL